MHKCIDCSKRVVRNKKLVYNRIIFTDDQGKIWNGFQCPSCKYGSRKPYVKASDKGKRLCRKCRRALPDTRYFRHEHCESKDSWLDWREVSGLTSTEGCRRSRYGI
jgi:hypothetical protein